MLPSHSASASSRRPPCGVRVRRLVVAAWPSSPVSSIACPAALAFLVAFYLLHALGLAVATKPYEACPQLSEYARQVLVFAAMLLVAHSLAVVPNLARNVLLKRGGKSTRASDEAGALTAVPTRSDAADGEADPPMMRVLFPRARSSSSPSAAASSSGPLQRRSLTLAIVYVTLHALQQALWVALLLAHLTTNYRTWGVVDSLLDGLKVAEAALATGEVDVSGGPTPTFAPNDPNRPSVCGTFSSIHVVRWTLVAGVVTTAVALSLLILFVQDATALLVGVVAGLRNSRRGRTKRRSCRDCLRRAFSSSSTSASASTPRSPSSPTPASGTWLDLQTDEAERDDPQEEDDDDEHPLRNTL